MLLFFSVSLTLWLVARAKRGRSSLPPRALFALLLTGTLGFGGHFVGTIESVGWLDGVVGFIVLASALTSAHTIGRLCPSCRHGLRLEEMVVNPPTRNHPGVGATLRLCGCCGFHEVKTHTLARLAETANEAIPWAPTTGEARRAFGAHYASGSSASLRWGSTAKGPDDEH